VIILGVILLLLGLLAPGLAILFWPGVIILAIGGLLVLAGGIGYPVGGRRHYW
jgi:hypothetical protein